MKLSIKRGTGRPSLLSNYLSHSIKIETTRLFDINKNQIYSRIYLAGPHSNLGTLILNIQEVFPIIQ